MKPRGCSGKKRYDVLREVTVLMPEGVALPQTLMRVWNWETPDQHNVAKKIYHRRMIQSSKSGEESRRGWR